jgi:4-hydroxy-3-polyprenylbenzoate decarboxylase
VGLALRCVDARVTGQAEQGPRERQVSGTDPDRLVVAITGASGVIFGIRLLEALRDVDGIESHLLISAGARATLAMETDVALAEVKALADVVHSDTNLAAPISSGSYRTRGMIIAPCSIKTLSGIATSNTSNLIVRAADVTLKERRPLVLLVRETPLHLGHLKLMVQAAEIGAIIMPPVPAFYHRPQTLSQVIDQTVGRTLDQIGLETSLVSRWTGPSAGAPADRLARP